MMSQDAIKKCKCILLCLMLPLVVVDIIESIKEIIENGKENTK